MLVTEQFPINIFYAIEIIYIHPFFQRSVVVKHVCVTDLVNVPKLILCTVVRTNYEQLLCAASMVKHVYYVCDMGLIRFFSFSSSTNRQHPNLEISKTVQLRKRSVQKKEISKFDAILRLIISFIPVIVPTSISLHPVVLLVGKVMLYFFYKNINGSSKVLSVECIIVCCVCEQPCWLPIWYSETCWRTSR